MLSGTHGVNLGSDRGQAVPDLSSRIGGRDHFVYHYNMMVRCVS